MVMANHEGIIVLINSQTEQLFGYRRDELIGQSVELLVPERAAQRTPELPCGLLCRPEGPRHGGRA